CNVQVQPDPKTIRRTDFDQQEAEYGSHSKQNPADADPQGTIAEDLTQNRYQQDGDEDSGADVKQHSSSVDDALNTRGGGKCVQVNRGKGENQQKSEPPTAHSPCTPENKFSHSPQRAKKTNAAGLFLGYPTASLRGAPEVSSKSLNRALAALRLLL